MPQLAFSEDGQTLFTGAGDGSLGWWRDAIGEAVGTWRGADAVAIVALSADGTRLAAAPIFADPTALQLWRRLPLAPGGAGGRG